MTRLEYIRRSRGWTQKDLAKILFTSRDKVSMMERQLLRKPPSKLCEMRMLYALNYSFNELMQQMPGVGYEKNE